MLLGVILRSQLLVLLQHRHFCDSQGRPLGREPDEKQEIDLETEMRTFFRRWVSRSLYDGAGLANTQGEGGVGRVLKRYGDFTVLPAFARDFYPSDHARAQVFHAQPVRLSHVHAPGCPPAGRPGPRRCVIE